MALFKTTDEVKNYIVIDVNTKFTKLKPSIDDAELSFIKPLLGSAQYEALHTAYQNAPGTALSAELAALLPYVQKALANYAAFLATEELGVSVGDLGIQQHSNQNSSPAPSWKVKDLKIKYLTTADKAADLLLEFLEAAAVIPDGGAEADRLYKEWYDSEANTKLSGCIVYKTAIANKYIDINDSRRLFLRLKKRINELEQSVIKRIICQAQYNELVAKIKTNDLTAEQNSLLLMIEPIVAKRALYETLPFLPISVESDGLYMLSQPSGTAGVNQKNLAGKEEKSALMKALKEGAVGYEEDETKLHDFILANIANYPLISGSDCWNASPAATDERWKIDNDPCNKSFST